MLFVLTIRRGTIERDLRPVVSCSWASGLSLGGQPRRLVLGLDNLRVSAVELDSGVWDSWRSSWFVCVLRFDG
jgi:hypothetical protein